MDIIFIVLIIYIVYVVDKAKKEEAEKERLRREQAARKQSQQREREAQAAYKPSTANTMATTSSGSSTTPYLDSLKEKYKEQYEKMKADKERLTKPSNSNQVDYDNDSNPYTDNYEEDYEENYRQNYRQNYKQQYTQSYAENYKQSYNEKVNCVHTTDEHEAVINDFKNPVDCIHDDESTNPFESSLGNSYRRDKYDNPIQDNGSTEPIKIFRDRKTAISSDHSDYRITFGNEDDEEAIKYY